MIPKIKKILYTTDLSKNSAYVFRYAINTAEMHKAKIDILYVLQRTPVFPEGEPISADPDENQALAIVRKRVDAFLQEETKDNPDRGKLVSSLIVIAGNPVVKILEKIDELKPDVLVMGTHSKGFISHTFLGSVATNILQRSRIPVFIIPLPAN